METILKFPVTSVQFAASLFYLLRNTSASLQCHGNGKFINVLPLSSLIALPGCGLPRWGPGCCRARGAGGDVGPWKVCGSWRHTAGVAGEVTGALAGAGLPSGPTTRLDEPAGSLSWLSAKWKVF